MNCILSAVGGVGWYLWVCAFDLLEIWMAFVGVAVRSALVAEAGQLLSLHHCVGWKGTKRSESIL